jgi:hypothetical protein
MYILKFKNGNKVRYGKVHSMVGDFGYGGNDIVLTSDRDKALVLNDYDHAVWLGDMVKRNPDFAQELVFVERW